MVTWSPDDKYLLSSAVDNEVRQYLAANGELDRCYDIKKTYSDFNYSRSYYMNGSDYIIGKKLLRFKLLISFLVGSCEESVVRIFSSQTGKLLRDVELQTKYTPSASCILLFLSYIVLFINSRY
jgi:hypothetical protein